MPTWRAYDDLSAGDTFPQVPSPFVVTEEVARDYGAIAASSLVGGDDIAADRSSVPPMLAAVYIRGAQNELKGPPGGIHAKQHFTFCRPVVVGDRLGTLLTIKDKYEKKGRRYVVAETVTRNQSDDIVTIGEITFIWGREQ